MKRVLLRVPVALTIVGLVQAAPVWPARQPSAHVSAPPASWGRDNAPAARAGDKPPTFLDVEDLVGTWHSPDGSLTIKIGIKDITAHLLTLTEKHTTWDGTYRPITTPSGLLGVVSSAEPLYFTRFPTADEMADATVGVGHQAPEWARQEVQGTLQWYLELRPHAGARAGEVVLQGEFYPGEITWSQEKDPTTGVVLQQEASVTGKGTGRAVTYIGVDDGE